MGLNIAIVIGIETYDTQTKLEACKKDAINMVALLNAMGKYDEILIINDDRVESADLKDKIPQFIQKYEGKEVDEVFMYYSGHGGLLNDEFIYVPTDYDTSKPNSTSYKNSEVDNQLRRLNPKLAVKVIDACHCGEHYVKDVDPYEKSIHSTKGSFHNCYFFFSSHDFQASETDTIMGYFTRAWFEAIVNAKRSPVKYRELTDYIADKFQSNKKQIPFFVTQGTSLEEFCNKTPQVEQALNDIMSGKATSAAGVKEGTSTPLLEAIKADAANYRSDEQIVSLLQEIQQQITSFELQEELSSILSLEFRFLEGLSGFNKKSEVGEWLKKNGKNHYKATYEQSQMVEAKALFSPLGEQKTLEEMYGLFPNFPKYYVSGFSVGIELPYNVIKLDYKSNFPNVGSYVGTITFIPSRTELRFFYYLTRDNDTRSTRYQSLTPLATISCLYKNEGEVLNGVKQITENFQRDILADLNSQFLDPSTGIIS